MLRQMVIVMALCAVMIGCGGGCTPGAPYVEADRATFDAIAPEYLQYVDGDSALSAEQKERRKRLVESWGLRVKKGEAALTSQEQEAIQKEPEQESAAPADKQTGWLVDPPGWRGSPAPPDFFARRLRLAKVGCLREEVTS